MKLRPPPNVLALALLGVAGAACSSSPYDSAAYDPYLTYSTFPAEVYYSSYYWADPFYFYYRDGAYVPRAAPNSAAITVSADAGAPAPAPQTVGEALRALARGVDVCPSHVSVVPHMVPNPCPANASDRLRGGASIRFVDCTLASGGTLNGEIEVETTRAASDESCNSETSITITQSVGAKNLSYVTATNRRIFIPRQTATGTTSFVINERPETAIASLDGSMQMFGAGGELMADRSYSFYVTVTPDQATSALTIDGTMTLADADGSSTTALTGVGLTRTSDCCYPTGGTLSATRSGMRPFDLHTWTFNSTCSGVAFDGRAITLGACL
jgi:hypothetical protein